MGYCIEMNKSTFAIKKENEGNALKALKDFAQKQTRLMWVSIGDLVQSESLSEAFEEIRYPLVDKGDHYQIDYFRGEKLGDDYSIFYAISPYVESSYIEMMGEDGEKWRWVFENGKCEEIYPQVTWDM